MRALRCVFRKYNENYCFRWLLGNLYVDDIFVTRVAGNILYSYSLVYGSMGLISFSCKD